MSKRVVMLKIAQRYLIINFLPTFLVSTFFWVSFLIIFQLFRIIGVIMNKGVDIWIFLSIIGNIAIAFLPIAVPISLFFAVYFSLNKLSEDSEIIAMRAFGMSPLELFKPYLITGIFISFAMFALVQNIIPNAQRQYRNSVIMLTSQGTMKSIKKEEFFTDIPNVILFAGDVRNKGNHLYDVFIQMDSKEDNRVIVAKEGILKKIPSKQEYEFPEVRLLLKDGNIFSEGKESSSNIFFKEYDFPVFSGGFRLRTIYKRTMMSSAELARRIFSDDYYDKRLKEVAKERGTEIENVRKDIDKDMRSYRGEFWSRLATPFQCLLFVFAAFCLGIKKGRGGQGAGATAFGVIVLYYSLFFLLVGLSKKGTIPSFLVPIIPVTIVFILSMRFYKKLEWNS